MHRLIIARQHVENFGVERRPDHFAAQTDVAMVAIHQQANLPAPDAVGIQIGKRPLRRRSRDDRSRTTAFTRGLSADVITPPTLVEPTAITALVPRGPVWRQPP